MLGATAIRGRAAPCDDLAIINELVSSYTLVLRFSELGVMDRGVLAEKLAARQAHWRRLRDRFQYDENALVTLYEGVRDKMPLGGYYRALEEAEVLQILHDGRMQLGQYFAFKDHPPRVGHSGNFLFVRCSGCPAEWFRDGETGSGVVNIAAIPAGRLEVVIP